MKVYSTTDFTVPQKEIFPLRGSEEFPGLKSSDRAPHEEILHRAYMIWENEGHPQNRALSNWLQAEAEIMPLK